VELRAGTRDWQTTAMLALQPDRRVGLTTPSAATPTRRWCRILMRPRRGVMGFAAPSAVALGSSWRGGAVLALTWCFGGAPWPSQHQACWPEHSQIRSRVNWQALLYGIDSRSGRSQHGRSERPSGPCERSNTGASVLEAVQCRTRWNPEGTSVCGALVSARNAPFAEGRPSSCRVRSAPVVTLWRWLATVRRSGCLLLPVVVVTGAAGVASDRLQPTWSRSASRVTRATVQRVAV